MSQAQRQLKRVGINSARLDCLILLEDELGKDRSWLLAHPETRLQGPSLKRLDKKLKRRMEHELMAYIRGFSEFYERKFFANKDVLEPRPESETMIELLLDLVDSRQKTVDSRILFVDVGTGSGALAITAKLEFPEAEVIAIDIDLKCLVVAHRNAKLHNVKIKFLQGNLLEPALPFILHSPFSILLCNLPYVPDKFQINEAAAREPKTAIFGGPDGLDVYRRLFHQLQPFKGTTLRGVKYVLTESLPTQHQKLAQIARKSGYRVVATEDFIQCFAPDLRA